MSFLDRFRKSVPPPSPPPIVHTMLATNIRPAIIKTGKWVLHLPTGQPGILNGVDAFPLIDVMLVNEIGENYRQERCTLEQIRIARLMEIPEKRRPTPDAGAALGYF